MAAEKKIVIYPAGGLIEVNEEAPSKKMQDAFAAIFGGSRHGEFARRCDDIKDVVTEFPERIQAEEAAAEGDADGQEFRSLWQPL